MTHLTSFPLFPQLPPELRLQIFQTARPPPRVIHIYEIEDDSDESSESGSDNGSGSSIASTSTIVRRINRSLRLRNRSFGRPKIQRQLEYFGFTSSHPQPPLELFVKLDNYESNHDAFREGSFNTATPAPSLLHTSTEARHAFELLGYRHLFGTRTCQAHIYFNPALDCLYLQIGDHKSITLDHGGWNIGQIPAAERSVVRYLALDNSPEDHFDGESWKWAVSLFGNLEELYIVLATYVPHLCAKNVLHEYADCVTLPSDIVDEEEADMETVFTPAETFDLINWHTMSNGWSLHDVNNLLRSYRDSGGDEALFLSMQAQNLTEQLIADRAQRAGDWKIPKLNFVFASTKLGKAQLLARRILEREAMPSREEKRRVREEERREEQRVIERRQQRERDRLKTEWEDRFSDDLEEYRERALNEWYQYHYEDYPDCSEYLGGFGIDY